MQVFPDVQHVERTFTKRTALLSKRKRSQIVKVSKLLDRDFFREFSEKCLNGEVAIVDKQMAENSISLLLPEDKLHTVLPSQTMDVVEEYLLMPRKKPLVIFYSGARSRNLPRFVCKKGEEIYGEGMVRKIRLEPAELMHFELGVMSLAKMPQKVVVIDRADRDTEVSGHASIPAGHISVFASLHRA